MWAAAISTGTSRTKWHRPMREITEPGGMVSDLVGHVAGRASKHFVQHTIEL